MTSLGFGHVSGLVAVVHPQAFIAALDPEQRAAYVAESERAHAGRPAPAGVGDGRWAPLYERPADRRFDHDVPEKVAEAAMLLDPDARLGENGTYNR